MHCCKTANIKKRFSGKWHRFSWARCFSGHLANSVRPLKENHTWHNVAGKCVLSTWSVMLTAGRWAGKSSRLGRQSKSHDINSGVGRSRSGRGIVRSPSVGDIVLPQAVHRRRVSAVVRAPIVDPRHSGPRRRQSGPGGEPRWRLRPSRRLRRSSRRPRPGRNARVFRHRRRQFIASGSSVWYGVVGVERLAGWRELFNYYYSHWLFHSPWLFHQYETGFTKWRL